MMLSSQSFWTGIIAGSCTAVLIMHRSHVHRLLVRTFLRKSDIVIALGSTNPGKLQACHDGFAAQNLHVSVVGKSVSSGVSDEPADLHEMITGARNRAASAFSSTHGAKYGVGLESGLLIVDEQYFDVCVCAIYVGPKACWVGISSGWLLPPRIAGTISQLGCVPTLTVIICCFQSHSCETSIPSQTGTIRRLNELASPQMTEATVFLRVSVVDLTLGRCKCKNRCGQLWYR